MNCFLENNTETIFDEFINRKNIYLLRGVHFEHILYRGIFEYILYRQIFYSNF